MPLSINVETLRLQALLLGGDKIGGIHRAAKAKLESLGSLGGLNLSPAASGPFDRLTQNDSREVGLNASSIIDWINSVELPSMVEGVLVPGVPAVPEVKDDAGNVTAPAVDAVPAVLGPVPATPDDATKRWHVETLCQLVNTLDTRL